MAGFFAIWCRWAAYCVVPMFAKQIKAVGAVGQVDGTGAVVAAAAVGAELVSLRAASSRMPIFR
jgi:hypothetical protein